MGRYINEIKGVVMGPDADSKCLVIQMHGGIELKSPDFQPNLVVVVDNIMFGAASYVESERDFKDFISPDGRSKRWFILKDVDKYAK